MNLALALSLFATAGLPAAPSNSPNVVVIILDDVGVDKIGKYAGLGAGTNPPCTPNIDQLADNGMLFTNAWTNPKCSATRAQILTGRHGFRTGIGNVVTPGVNGIGLPTQTETIIPEMLTNYASSAVGKWHLANAFDIQNEQGPDHPLHSGFGYFAGSRFNLNIPCLQDPFCLDVLCAPPPFGYYHWVKTFDVGPGPNGVQLTGICTTTYATTDTANEAIARAAAMPEPWFLYVAFNAAHDPANKLGNEPSTLLCPPSQSCPNAPTYCTDPPDPGEPNFNSDRVKASISAMDTEIGRMLQAIRIIDEDVSVILIGDNGTAASGLEAGETTLEGSASCQQTSARVKGSLYEGGINVPLIVNSPMIPQSEEGTQCDALVSSTDLYATIADMANESVSQGTAQDSVSFMPCLTDHTMEPRQMVYAELFKNSPSGVVPTKHDRTVRNDRYKLIRRTDANNVSTEEFYDLLNDPCESTDLFDLIWDVDPVGPNDPPPPPTPLQVNYTALRDELVTMGVY